MIDRKTYWCYVVTYFTVMFCLAVLAELAGNRTFSASVDLLASVSSLVWWYIGYWRCKDAGVHGGWAIFTPIVIGMIWIGCLKSKPDDLVLE